LINKPSGYYGVLCVVEGCDENNTTVILLIIAFVIVVILVGSGVIFGKAFAHFDFRHGLAHGHKLI
jgi:hypothetical protein